MNNVEVTARFHSCQTGIAEHSFCSIIDPQHLAVNSIPPPVHIEQIMADDKPYNPAVSLPPHVRYLTIDYTALSLAVPEKVRFRYRLEGLDPGWREVINERKVQYSNLATIVSA